MSGKLHKGYFQFFAENAKSTDQRDGAIASVKEEIREKLSKVDDAFRRLEYFRQQIASLTIRH